MAVSHRWFIQWSPPSVIFADITRHYEDVHRSWQQTSGYESKDIQYAAQYPVTKNHGQRQKVKPKYGARSPVYSSYVQEEITGPDKEDVYDEYGNEKTGNDGGLRSRISGLSLWLTMLSLAQAQTKPADLDSPPFNTLYKWKQIDFEFHTPVDRSNAIVSSKFDPTAVLPLGLEVWGNRLFISLPSWRPGIPATLATVPVGGGVTSPLLQPYPDWSFHNAFREQNNCSGLTSVFRMSVDNCGRLWVLDSGQINSQDDPQLVCPPSVIVFNLTNDQVLHRYPIPSRYIMENSLFSNIVVDSRTDQCNDLHLYIADTWRFGLVVFRHSDEKFWRFSHPYFFPDPFFSNYSLHGVNFQWTDGIFGLSLTSVTQFDDRLLFFHSMSGDTEFFVPTSVLQNPSRVNNSADDFSILGPGRGPKGQSSASAVDRNGVMFYGLVLQDAIGCWNSHKNYGNNSNAVIVKNAETLIFPNDVKVDQNKIQNVWVLSNRLPLYQAGQISPDDYNYRILYANTKEAVRGTVCELDESIRP